MPGRDAGITHFSHIGLNTTNPQRDEKFWTTVFNARVSDWLGDTPLFRIATAHHSVVLFPTTQPGVQHINHQVEDIAVPGHVFFTLGACPADGALLGTTNLGPPVRVVHLAIVVTDLHRPPCGGGPGVCR